MYKLKEFYKKSKSSKVGESCVCPSCKNVFIKENYQQAFCKSKEGTVCKDYYWNNVTPNKRNNTTRISPANKAWQERMSDEVKWDRTIDKIESEFHPHDSYSLGQE